MGKTFSYIKEIDTAVSEIRLGMRNAKIPFQETNVQYGIKFICENGSSFILYFSKGKTSKIFFEKENEKTVSLIEKMCGEKEGITRQRIPISANYSISKSNQDLIQKKLEESFVIVRKEVKRNTIKYIFEITENDEKVTVTQFLSGKLLLQGIDSVLVTRIREIICCVEPISNVEEALTYIPEKQQAHAKKVIDQIEGFDLYCDKAKRALSDDAYNYLSIVDKKQIVTAFGLLEAIKENSIALPLYNPVVYPVAKAFEGFILKMMMDKKAFTLEEYKTNPEKAEIGNWLRNQKFAKYIKDNRRDGYINNSLIAAWEGIRCEELHSDPARPADSVDIITVEQAEAKIGAVCTAITYAYQIIVKNGFSEEEMLAQKELINQNKREIKEIPSFNCHIGTDESGKGDYFGPLVIAGVFLTKEDEKKLAEIGVKDSKSNSDVKNKQLALEITSILGKSHISVVCIRPERYNSLYAEMGNNLNKVLGWGHARAIENLLQDNICENVVSDQFGDESVIKSALLEKGKKIDLVQTPKGERDVGVAAASILARARFLDELEKLSNEAKFPLSKGVNTTVEESARQIYKQGGMDRLKSFAKIHFKTTQKIAD